MILLLLSTLAWAQPDPLAPASRLEMARTFAGNPELVEESRDILLGLLRVPEVRDQARMELARLVAYQPPRVGWNDTYQLLLKDSQVPSDLRDQIRLRSVEAPPWTTRERHRALSNARSLHARRPTDDLRLAIGQLYL